MLTTMAYAQQITQATGAEAVSADQANGAFTTLNGPVITETSGGQLSQDGTIIFTAPPGWEWDTGGTDPVVDVILAPGGTGTTKLEIDFDSRIASRMTFFVTQTSDQGPRSAGQAIFSNLRIRPTSGVLPNAGNITNTGSTAPAGTTNYGDLGIVEGVPAKVRVETQSDGTGQIVPAQDIEAGNALMVYAISRDQHDNFLENIAADSWSLENTGFDNSLLTAAPDGKSAEFSSTITGSAQIRASVNGLTSTDSETITVLPGNPSSLSIQTQPSSAATAGQDFAQQPVIDVLDVYGNRVTTNNSIVITASRGNGSGTLQGTTTLTIQQGRAAFADLNHLVANTINIDFNAGGFSKVTSHDIIIQPAPASKLAFTRQPTNSEVNQPITPAVEVQIQDNFGNNISQSGTSVTVAKDSGPENGSLTGTLIQTTNSSGAAAFSDLSFDQTNNTSNRYKIRASASGLDSVISQEFDITNPGMLTSFTIKNAGTGDDITTKTAGDIFPVEIQAVDGTGDVVTDFSGSVILTSNGDLTGEPDTTANFTSGILASHDVHLTSTGELFIAASQTLGTVSSNSNTFTVNPGPFDTDSSTISSDLTSITANGTSQAVITVQLKDSYGNNLTTYSGETVVLSTTAGTLDSVIPNGNGTFSAILTSSTVADTAAITGTVNGNSLSDDATVVFSPGILSMFTVEKPSGGPIDPQTAGQAFDIRITARDENGNTVAGFNGTVDITSDKTISSGGGTSLSFLDGVLSPHSITITRSGIATITAANSSGTETGTSADFTVNAGPATTTTTTITSGQGAIQNDGTDNTTITVQLKDEYGNNLTSNTGYSVVLTDNGANATLGTVTDNSDGTFSTILTSSPTSETVTITGTLNGTPIDDDASVLITEFNVWQSSGGGGPGPTAWHQADNWSLGTPASDQLIVIPTNPTGANKFPIVLSNPTVAFLEIQNGATVNVDPGYTMTILNDVTGGGTLIGDNSTFTIQGDIRIAQFTAGTSTVTLNGSAPQQIPGQLSADVLNIENTGGGITSTGYIDSNTLNINNSTLTMEAGSELVALGNINGNGTLIGNESNITLEGDVTVNSADVSTSDITVSGMAAQTINTIDEVRNITVSNTTAEVTFNSSLYVNQTLNIDNGATLTAREDLSGTELIGGGGTLKLAGNLDFTSVQAAPSTVEFIGGNEQQLIDFDAFNNLTINKTANGVTAVADVVVDGTLTLTDGSLIMGSGTNLLAPSRNLSGGTIKFQLELPSSGWYALSSPVASTYADFTDSVITQGYPGAFYSTGSLPGDTLQPNVLYYDESYAGTDNQRWRTLGNASDGIEESRGHFVYVFGDVPGDSRYTNSTPITLEVEGNEFTGDGNTVDFNITYTASADTGWNLIGNPYGATIDWDDEANWTKTNVDQTIYVWDHTANGGNGDYLVWNGFTGSLDNGLLAPFQGFWIKANGSNPVLTVSNNTKTTGGVYRKTRLKKKRKQKEEIHPVVELKLEANGLSGSSYISFSEEASRWKDPADAYRLIPFTDSFVQIFTTVNDGIRLAINNLPRKFGQVLEIPVHAGGLKEGKALEGACTISWPGMEHIPSEWQVLLEDRETNKVINLKRENFYSFDMKPSGSKSAANGSPNGQYGITSTSDNDDARFVLRINPRGDADGLPGQISLDQNYANPFSQSTIIRFGLPLENRVRLTVYDILGRKIAVLADETFDAGFHPVNWIPKGLASGIYLYVLQTEDKILSRKMTYIK